MTGDDSRYEFQDGFSRIVSSMYDGQGRIHKARKTVAVMLDYRLPLLSVIPKWLAHHYIRMAGKADAYYETHLALRGLRRLVRDFDIVDYTKKIIHDPGRFSATDMLVPGSMKHRISGAMIDAAYWLCPTYIWILRKKA